MTSGSLLLQPVVLLASLNTPPQIQTEARQTIRVQLQRGDAELPGILFEDIYAPKRRQRPIVQREIAMLRRTFRYGRQTGIVHNMPHFGLMKENNVRKGYVDPVIFERMVDEAVKEGLWLRALVETASTCGWRNGESIGLHVRQIATALLRFDGDDFRVIGAPSIGRVAF